MFLLFGHFEPDEVLEIQAIIKPLDDNWVVTCVLCPLFSDTYTPVSQISERRLTKVYHED